MLCDQNKTRPSVSNGFRRKPRVFETMLTQDAVRG
jgi:hypothetical protein